VTDGGALGVVLALRADDLVDLLFHQLGERTEPGINARGEPPLLRRADQIPSASCTRGGNPSSLVPTCSSATVSMADPPVSIDDFALATVATRPDEAEGPPPKYYELRDNLWWDRRVEGLPKVSYDQSQYWVD